MARARRKPRVCFLKHPATDENDREDLFVLYPDESWTGSPKDMTACSPSEGHGACCAAYALESADASKEEAQKLMRYVHDIQNYEIALLETVRPDLTAKLRA